MAFMRIFERTVGRALSAPVHRPDLKAAGRQLTYGFRVFFKKFRAAMAKYDPSVPAIVR